MSRPLMCLVDTNVWLDLFFGDRPGNVDARAFVDAAFDLDAELLYAVTSSKDLFYVLERQYKLLAKQDNDGVLTKSAAGAARIAAWACLEKLDDIATAVACDQTDVFVARAQRRVHDDYEDNLVVAAAMRAKADMLVTNDRALLQHSAVNALNCHDATVYLKASCR